MKWMIGKKYHGRMDEIKASGVKLKYQRRNGAKLGEIEASGAKWSKIGQN